MGDRQLLLIKFRTIRVSPVPVPVPESVCRSCNRNALVSSPSHAQTRKHTNTHSSSIGDNSLLGDTRWGGLYGVEADFLAQVVNNADIYLQYSWPAKEIIPSCSAESGVGCLCSKSDMHEKIMNTHYKT